MKRTLFSFILFITSLFVCKAQTNGWKNYLSYHDIMQVQAVNHKIYVLASNDLYVYNTTDHSIQTFDKASQLSDSGIKMISWNSVARKLIIVYNNYNIDLLSENGSVENIPDYLQKMMIASKTIHSIYNNGQYAYLSTAWGILKINVKNAEISENYDLAEEVTHSYIANGMLYAGVVTKGMYAVSLSANLKDKSNWHITGAYVAPQSASTEKEEAIVKQLKLDGPKYNAFASMLISNNKLYTVGGGYNPWKDVDMQGTVQVWNGKEWQIYQDNIESLTPNANYKSVLSVAVDPTDEQHVFVSGRTGLYEFKSGNFIKHYTFDNSPLKPAIHNNKNYVIVAGIAFDAQGNLWCLNSNNDENSSLLMLDKKGVWSNYHSNELTNKGETLRYLTSPVFDAQGHLWFVNSHWEVPCLAFFSPSTKQLKTFKHIVNQDGAELGDVVIRCVAIDKQQNIWIGTSNGPLLLPSSSINNSNPSFIQVKVPRNDGTNYADYLLSGVDITCIAVDGANRKWIGTNGHGVYLISADNLSQLQHFTAENSPLLSNNIESIAINPNTGEVFMGTIAGLCSYQSDATEANDMADVNQVYAYPNPVMPSYTGVITVRGLSFNADVKITTTNGALVAQGRSNGGTFIWDGTNLNGQPVASGMYFVLSATEDGQSGVVTKIAVIR